MGKKIDIEAMIGTQEGTHERLTLIGEGNGKPREDKSGFYRMVVCRCDCGNVVNVRLSNFVKGKVKSCGCLNNQIKKPNSICMDCLTDIGFIFPLCRFLLTAQPEYDMIYKEIGSSQNNRIVVSNCRRYTGMYQDERSKGG